MKNKRESITPAEAKRNLHALDVMSGNIPAELPKPQKRTQHEAKIQEAIFKWANLMRGKYPELQLMFHIINEGKRNIISGYHLKNQGMKSSLPDLCLPVARGQYHALYIELKAEKGRLQDNQRKWLDDLAGQGAKAVVCYGFDEAKTAIEEYLKLKTPT